MTITLNNYIDNASLQIGDTAWFIPGYSLSNINGQSTSFGVTPQLIGQIREKTPNTITIYEPVAQPEPGAYIMFSKANQVNKSGLKGYYASVTMQHLGTERAELFSISSEVIESSK
jgi:hypothetical protein